MQLETTGEAAVLYRHRGASVAPESYAASLWNGVLSQMVVCSLRTGGPIGLVACFEPDFRHGYARLAGILDPKMMGLGWPIEGFGTFVTHIFHSFPFRKLYIDIAGFNLPRMRSWLDSHGSLEGTLLQHEFHNGSYYDQYTYALYRDRWSLRLSQRLGSGRSTEFESFRDVLGKSIGLDLSDTHEQTTLTDAGFDSLMLVELLLFLEQTADFTLDEDLVFGLATMGDVFALASSYTASGQGYD
jgi:acyl carrier protein